ncbi:rho GDP-dissociation inhibitor 2-like isoform X2 [Pristis pectinata]|uniref:rho GDP-dissociation inhibitor 2-like isoform X2 n=1 Tax=Pristis pectinata TaxID=685728 RepID=UPI00223D831C|nr:rho GDP-dissociation inhibitor 2-like isoform X2 [Pristis pectinata]
MLCLALTEVTSMGIFPGSNALSLLVSTYKTSVYEQFQRSPDNMAEQEQEEHLIADEDEVDKALNYKAPVQKSLAEIVQLDQHDESLTKYKKTLLGEQIPQVAGDLQALKKSKVVLKQGVSYKMKINFKVNKEIVSGLKYEVLSYRKGIKVEKVVVMMGSYGPRAEEYEFVSPKEDVPKGISSCGTYVVKALFTDDDKTNHLSCKWFLCLRKDWDEDPGTE